MRVAVYCGSAAGNDPKFAQCARGMGTILAQQGIDLVFGGGKVGLMGIVADAVLDGGGKVYGVIPESLRDRELAHPGLTELQVVPNMHQRKAAMADMADAFIAMPGGPGTMDELFEAWTWGQLGYHNKPCALYNAFGYYDHLLAFVGTMANAGFLKQAHADMLIVEDQPEPLLDAIRAYQPPVRKWS
ncbi:TIGR00730 family Rossman fold protein [uncultured Marinobacter sp.]|uniref:LOG family protein n=1 Tax=uncultured Marinobacter sp. TaxID=187379 RepID=UPI0030D8EA7B